MSNASINVSAASKNDKLDNKPDYSLLPKIFCDQVSYCMGAGAVKYGRNNYTLGHELLKLTAAATRHIKQIEAGEDIDRDTSDRIGVEIYHWANVAACALMALHQLELGTLIDNRLIAPDLPVSYTKGSIRRDDTEIRFFNEQNQQITEAEFKSINDLTPKASYDTIEEHSQQPTTLAMDFHNYED